MISYSYFAGRACTLMDSDSTSVGFLPACVIGFLVPESLKVFINIVLLWSFCWCFSSWLVCFLWMMNICVMGGVMVHVMVYVMVYVMVNWVNVVVDIIMMYVIVRVLSIDDMFCSMCSLKGFMDSLWVNMVVIREVWVSKNVTVVKRINMSTIEAVDKWIVIDRVKIMSTMSISVFSVVKSVLCVIKSVLRVVISVVTISMFVVGMAVSMSISWNILMMLSVF